MTNRRRLFIGSIATAAVLASVRAAGQRAKRIPRIALVASFSVAEGTGANPVDPYLRSFVQGLRDLGLVDGKNIIVERRSTEGRIDRLPLPVVGPRSLKSGERRTMVALQVAMDVIQR